MERLRSGDPEQIGPWQIVNRLGSGGMGIVYMGTNGTRAAAIKVVRDFLLEDPASRTRLAREVDTLQRVKSEFVAEIVGSDVAGNPAWIATDYVDGPSLKTLIEKEGPLTGQAWLDFAKGFLSALASVHSVGVVHRDIKPSNILLAKTGPKLIDFGISFTNDATSLTGTGMVAGTPAWLAPEQFLGRQITTAVDNFAAGSTLMYAATGKTPWGAEDSSVGAVMHTILVSEPDISALTEFQIEIITPLLVKDPQLRKTASQMLKKLGDGPRGGSGKSASQQKAAEKTPRTPAIDKEREEQAKLRAEKEAARKAEEERRAKEREAAAVAKQKAKEEAKAKKAEAAKTQQPSNNKAIIAGIAIFVLIAGGFMILKPSGKKSPQAPVASPTAVQYDWSALVSGETKAQTGTGTKFVMFVCDQGVVASSLSVKNITSRASSAGPVTAKVIKGDARCGKDFDTIVVTGQEAAQPGSVNYYVSGTTSSNYDFRYDFTVTVLPR